MVEESSVVNDLFGAPDGGAGGDICKETSCCEDSGLGM